MISSLEFVHPETQRALRETELKALEKVLPMCEPKPPAALKLTRAYELSRRPTRSPEEAKELAKMQATANDELEALRAQAAETTQRDQPEATGDVAQLLTDAQNAISLQSAVENGWVTKSRGVKLPKTSSTLCPYSRNFVGASLQDQNLVNWLQKVEEQLDVIVKSTASVKARPTAQFPNLTAKKRGMLHEVCTHFGLDCVGENDKSAASKTELRPMTVTWTEFACWPRCLPSKAANALGAERASLNDFQTSFSHNFTHAVYLPDSSVDEIQERVKADVPEGTAVQVHHLGARHVVVEFEEKLAAQKFLRPFRSESTSPEWWSGDIAFGKWQFEQRAKHDSRSNGNVYAARANAPVVEPAENAAEKQRRLLEMGFSAADAAAALTKAGGNVEAAAQALIEESKKKEEEPEEQEEQPSAVKKEKKSNDKADWVRASQGKSAKARPKSGKK
jgi:hypothetical protein